MGGHEDWEGMKCGRAGGIGGHEDWEGMRSGRA